jgi:hypothetical protein
MMQQNSNLKTDGVERQSEQLEQDRRWFVKALSRRTFPQYVQAIHLALPVLPNQGWLPASMRSVEDLPKHFQLTKNIEEALLFTQPIDAHTKALQIEEFGFSADVIEVEQFNEETEKVSRSATNAASADSPRKGLNQWRL